MNIFKIEPIQQKKLNTHTMLHERIRQRRTQLGLTQQVLAARIGVNKATVSYWEKGQSLPGTPENVNGLLRGLQTNADWLYKGKGSADAAENFSVEEPRSSYNVINEEERQLMNRYRALSEYDKQTLQRVLRALETKD